MMRVYTTHFTFPLKNFIKKKMPVSYGTDIEFQYCCQKRETILSIKMSKDEIMSQAGYDSNTS